MSVVEVMEQEVSDVINAIARDSKVFFPEFCSVVLRKLREEDEDQLAQFLFKVMFEIAMTRYNVYIQYVTSLS